MKLGGIKKKQTKIQICKITKKKKEQQQQQQKKKKQRPVPAVSAISMDGINYFETVLTRQGNQ
jgi:hypothetical protein